MAWRWTWLQLQIAELNRQSRDWEDRLDRKRRSRQRVVPLVGDSDSNDDNAQGSTLNPSSPPSSCLRTMGLVPPARYRKLSRPRVPNKYKPPPLPQFDDDAPHPLFSSPFPGSALSLVSPSLCVVCACVRARFLFEHDPYGARRRCSHIGLWSNRALCKQATVSGRRRAGHAPGGRGCGRRRSRSRAELRARRRCFRCCCCWEDSRSGCCVKADGRRQAQQREHKQEEKARGEGTDRSDRPPAASAAAA